MRRPKLATHTLSPEGPPSDACRATHEANPIVSRLNDHLLRSPVATKDVWAALTSSPEKLDVLDDEIAVAAAIGSEASRQLLESQARNHYASHPVVEAKRSAGAGLLASCEQCAPLVVAERDACAAAVDDRPLYDWVCSFREHAGGFLGVLPVIVEVVVLAAFIVAGLYFESLNAVYFVGEANLGLEDRPWNCVGLVFAFVAGLLVWQQFATAFQPAAQRRAHYRLISRLALPVGFGALVLYGFVTGSMHETPDPFSQGFRPDSLFKYVMIAALVVLAVGLKCGLTLLSSSLFALWRYDFEPDFQRRRALLDTAALDHAVAGWRSLQAQVEQRLEADKAAEQAYVDRNLAAYAWRIELAKAEVSSAKLKLFRA